MELKSKVILGPRRIALIAAIVAVVLVIVFYPLIIETPIDLSKVSVGLSKVEVVTSNQTDRTLTINPTFSITNNSTITLTTESIDFQLFANGRPVGSGSVSYADVPVVGRPEIFSNTTVHIPGSLDFQLSNDNAGIFKMVRDNSTQISWSTNGTATIESGTTVLPKDFSAELRR